MAPLPPANFRPWRPVGLLAGWGLTGGLGLMGYPALSLAQEGLPTPAPASFEELRSQGSQGPTLRVLLAEAASLRISATDRPLALRFVGGSDRLELAPGQGITLTLEGGSVVFQVDQAAATASRAREIWLEPLETGFSLGLAKPAGDFGLKQRSYRGRLQLLVKAATLQAINHLDLETYLTSVVGSEMPATWPQAALRAQAVAARTYAFKQRSPSQTFDVGATVASQVYGGVDAETPSTREAVAKTRGQVLMYGPKLINAVFHSSSGGSTENSGDLWREQLPYLVSVPDLDQEGPVSRWQQKLEPPLLRKAFAETGGANRIDVLSTTSSGRVRQARVVGPLGTLVITGPELRSRLGLRSTMVHFQVVSPQLAAVQLGPVQQEPIQIDLGQGTPQVMAPPPVVSPLEALAVQNQPNGSSTLVAIGRGFGHGVGMSQWGAYALALRGEDYPQILRYYFRGTELKAYAAP